MRVALDGYDGGFRIGRWCITSLRYADDIVLIASSEEELRTLVNRVRMAATEFGMAINTKKTEVMKVSDDPHTVRHTEHVTNEEVLGRVSQRRRLLGQVKSRKLKYFGRVTRHNTLEKDILLGTMPGKRRQGGQKKQWLDDITQWSGQSLVSMVRMAEDRARYRRFIHEVAYVR